jgi:serine/threonine protein kinase
MSPEQCGGGPDSVDTRTDIYSLGVVLFELIAGRLPYDVAGCTLSETAQIVRHTTPRPLEMAAIPEPQRRLTLARVISTCLQKKPARRYARVSELSTDLRDILRRAPPNTSDLRNRDTKAAASSTARGRSPLLNLELHTIAGPFPRTGLRPITPGVEGSVVSRFDAPFPIDSARLRAEAVVWSAGDPIPYDPLARTAVDVSPNGRDWTTLNVRDAQRGGGFFMGDDITSIVHNSREVWIRGRVRSSVDWPGEGMIHAQFLHTTDEADTPPLVLEAYAAEASDNSLAAEQVHGARGQ